VGFRLTVQAEKDIVDIAETSLRLFGEAQAWSYHSQLFDLFDLIAAKWPASGMRFRHRSGSIRSRRI